MTQKGAGQGRQEGGHPRCCRATPPHAQKQKVEGVLGWGGRIRTSTVCINSAASYQLDHAPAARLFYLDVNGGCEGCCQTERIG